MERKFSEYFFLINLILIHHLQENLLIQLFGEYLDGFIFSVTMLEDQKSRVSGRAFLRVSVAFQ